MKDASQNRIRTLAEAKALSPETEAGLSDALDLLLNCFCSGGKLLICGNGGSAADAEHIVGELMKGFLLRRPLSEEKQERFRSLFPEEAEALISGLQEGIPAISLSSQTALMTAFSNDVSADLVFAQQVLGYGQSGDVLLAISTSGNSSNILKAAMAARVQGLRVLALTGADGGKLKPLADIAVCAPSRETYVIQEYHISFYHCLCACVEDELFGS